MFAYRPKATPFAGEACETKHLVARMESCRKEDSWNSSVTLFTAILQVSTRYLCGSGCCVGIRLAMALIDDARQAMSEEKVVQLKLRPWYSYYPIFSHIAQAVLKVVYCGYIGCVLV